MSETHSQNSLLIVDDDVGLRETLSDFFEMEGYAVTQAGNIAEARQRLAAGHPDLILLDVNMPGGTGLSLATEIRSSAATPIIILSGKGEMVDRVVGLEVGADDYLVKPFELRELLARVRAVLRRASPQPPQGPVSSGTSERAGRFANLTIVPGRRKVESELGETLDLTGAEYNLLAAFVERANRVLSRDMLAEITRRDDWDGFDRSIDTMVSRLRRKLAPYTDAGSLIQTVRGEGYVLAADVRWTGPATS